jgi:lipooligosaccharide transport system permease protein
VRESRTLGARVVPAPVLAGGGARKLLERNWLVYRRIWLLVFSGFFEPLFYLFSIGVGIGALVGDVVTDGGQTVRYTAYVAPALMAAAAMNGAIYESTFNIFFKLRYGKVYDAILATPMKPTDIAIGEITWSLGRGVVYAVGFLGVMLGMGLIASPWAILAVPAAVLIGFAFAACGMAATTFMKSWQDFDLVTLVTLPLFLFSATFYPLSVYPRPFQIFTQFSPLYHGVELIRAFTLGTVDWGVIPHIGFLAGLGGIGVAIASRRLEKLLLS